MTQDRKRCELKSNTCHITSISQGAIRTQVPNSNRRNKICLHLTTESATPSVAVTHHHAASASRNTWSARNRNKTEKLSPSNHFAFTAQYRCTDHGTIGKTVATLTHLAALWAKRSPLSTCACHPSSYTYNSDYAICYFRMCHPPTSKQLNLSEPEIEMRKRKRIGKCIYIQGLLIAKSTTCCLLFASAGI